MKKNQKIFVALGSVLLLLGTTLPLRPQVLRKKNLPVQADPPVATPKVPTEQVIAPPAARTRVPTERVIELPAKEEPESRTYEKPRYMDDRLDWCLNWGFNCGKPAAVAFCHRRRFEEATAFEAEVVGRSAQTRVMGTDLICNADFCTAFSYITCSGPIGMDRVFANPEWKGYRLDVCLVPGGYCGGRQAADRFCAANGFWDSLDSTPDREPGKTPTRSAGTGEICEKGCKGFQQIICRNR
jgi:hypothetical protein